MFPFRFPSPNFDIDMDFRHHKINSASGLYFEEMGNMRVYHSEWAFVTYVDLTYFKLEANHLERTIHRIQRLCDSIKELELPTPSSYCNDTMPQLHNLLKEIKEYNIDWFFNSENDPQPFEANEINKVRRKRGFLSSISKRIFFPMSEDDAAFFKNQINVLKHQNVEYMSLIRNHTTLFQDTLKVLNNTMSSQMAQHTVLQQQFDDVEFVLNNSTASSVLSSKLSALMQYTTFLIISLSYKQRYCYEAVTIKSKSLQLIAPAMFMNELRRVSELIEPQGLELPLPLTAANLPNFYKLTTSEGAIVDNQLVLRFSLPLVQARQFTLYKVISVPNHNKANNTFSVIMPRTDYIALDAINDQFVTLTGDELKTCHQTETSFVCKQTFAIISANNSYGCEINILRQTNVTSGCDIDSNNVSEERWMKLQKPNTYLYTLPKEQFVVVVCPSSRTNLTLIDTGIISLSYRCRIKTERVEIVALQYIETEATRNFLPSHKVNISVADEIDRAKNTKSLENPQLPALNSADAVKVTEIHGQLSDLQLQSRINIASILSTFSNSDEEPGSVNPLIIIIGIILIVILIILTFVCFKYCALSSCSILGFLVVVVLVITGVFYVV